MMSTQRRSSQRRPITVWIIEDHATYRSALARLLATDPLITCSLAVATAEEAVAELRRAAPDVILLDLALPGLSRGQAIRAILTAQPDANVVALTVHDDDESIRSALQAGAIGYLVKGEEPAVLDAVWTALEGSPLHAGVARRALTLLTGRREAGLVDKLTPRQAHVIRLLVQGHTKAQIASTLELSPHTVDSHVRAIYKTLGVRTRGGLVAKALQARLV